MADISTPATEAEIAEAIRWAADHDCLTIRKLAYERDRIRSALQSALSLLRQGKIVAAENDLRKANDNDYRD